jgi:hypothetical protein
VVVCVVALTINRIVARVYAHKEWRELHTTGRSTAPGDEKYAQLEERVRVLERIATDGNSTLAHQIEQLRDLQDTDHALASRETMR